MEAFRTFGGGPHKAVGRDKHFRFHIYSQLCIPETKLWRMEM